MVRMDALPNDPELLTILTKQKVDVTVSPGEDPAAGALGGVLSSLAFPLILFLGLLFLTRKSGDEEDGGGGGMGGGGPGGMGNPSMYSNLVLLLLLEIDVSTDRELCTCVYYQFSAY
jgi:cell division protease FtsH